MFNNKILLITGGTGSFGNAVLNKFLNSNIKEIRIFSRDEKKQDERNTFYRPAVPVSLNQASMGKDISWLAAAANASSSPTTGRKASSLSSYICSGVDMRLRAGNFDAGHPSLIEDTESKNRDAGSHSRPPQQAPSSSTCTTPCRQQDMTQEAASRKDPDPRPNEGECDDGNEVNGDGCGDSCQTERGYSCNVNGCAVVLGDGIVVGEELRAVSAERPH